MGSSGSGYRNVTATKLRVAPDGLSAALRPGFPRPGGFSRRLILRCHGDDLQDLSLMGDGYCAGRGTKPLRRSMRTNHQLMVMPRAAMKAVKASHRP